MRRVLSRIWAPALAALGAVVAVVSLWSAWSHAAVPAGAGRAPARWPGDSAIARREGLPTLVMFAHPRCPCTRASLDELRHVLSGRAGRVDAQLWVVIPPGAPAAWSDGSTLTSAADIPGLSIHFDRGGVEAARFDAGTSGQVVLYDPSGRLRYHGGVTGARGHEGDNRGRERVIAQLDRARPEPLAAPVYGCELVAGAR